MESLTSGTLAGTGSFRCEECGYVVNLAAPTSCRPARAAADREFARASLFAAGRFQRQAGDATTAQERDDLIAEARELIDDPGAVPRLARRHGGPPDRPSSASGRAIGRTLAADVRFDDPTVSRRHALIVRQADGVRVLDDRSLNGVFVNGERVEWRALQRRRRDRRRPPPPAFPRSARRRPAVAEDRIAAAQLTRSDPFGAASARIAPMADNDRGPLAEGRHRQDDGRAAHSPTSSAAPGSTCWPSTSTRRATCRTTSTSRPTRARPSATCSRAAPRPRRRSTTGSSPRT